MNIITNLYFCMVTFYSVHYQRALEKKYKYLNNVQKIEKDLVRLIAKKLFKNSKTKRENVKNKCSLKCKNAFIFPTVQNLIPN